MQYGSSRSVPGGAHRIAGSRRANEAPRALLQDPAKPSTLLVPLTSGAFATIDEADGPAVGAIRWHLNVCGPGQVYARSRRAGVGYLHLFLWRLWGMPATPFVDHRNMNGLDCRRENLRAATKSQNTRNSRLRRNNRSGFKGVTETSKGWRAQCRFDGRNHHLGYFDTPEEAHAAYFAAACEHAGEFARAR